MTINLTIAPKYTNELMFPESYIFQIEGVEMGTDSVSAKLKRLGYRWNNEDGKWWKRRYANNCSQRKRQEEISKLKQILPALQVTRRANINNQEEQL